MNGEPEVSGDQRWPDNGMSVAGTLVLLALVGLGGALERLPRWLGGAGSRSDPRNQSK